MCMYVCITHLHEGRSFAFAGKNWKEEKVYCLGQKEATRRDTNKQNGVKYILRIRVRVREWVKVGGKNVCVALNVVRL